MVSRSVKAVTAMTGACAVHPPARHVLAGSHDDEIAPALPMRISQCVRDRVQ